MVVAEASSSLLNQTHGAIGLAGKNVIKSDLELLRMRKEVIVLYASLA